MARRDRSRTARRVPHPAWAWVRQAVPLAVKTLAGVAVVGMLVSAGLAAFITWSPYFRVSAIEIRLEPGQRWIADPRIGYRLHPPVHIFRADLPALAQAIRRDHPQLASVIVRRELPNRIVAQVNLREPVGQVRARRYYLVGADGIVLAPGASTAWEGLPVLLVGSRAAAYQPGQSCASPEFLQAVSVLGDIRRSQALGRHRISAIRIGDTAAEGRTVTVVLDNGLELRAAPGDLSPRLARLGELFRSRRPEVEHAQYVDLRFDDLVIGMRGAE